MTSLVFGIDRGGRRPGRLASSRPEVGTRSGIEGDPGFVVEPQVSVVNFQRQGGEGRAVYPASLGAIQALVGIPAPGLMARGALEPDDLIAGPGVPAGPGLAAVLIERQ